MVAGIRGSGSGEWQWRQTGTRCPIRHPTRPAQDGTLMSHGGDPRTVRTAWWLPLLPGAVHKKAGVPLSQSPEAGGHCEGSLGGWVHGGDTQGPGVGRRDSERVWVQGGSKGEQPSSRPSGVAGPWLGFMCEADFWGSGEFPQGTL